MASAEMITTSFGLVGAMQSMTSNATLKSSAANLGIACPTTKNLRASFICQRRASRLSQQPSFQVSCKSISSEVAVLDKEEEGGVLQEGPSPLSPSTFEVQSLLEDICEETIIAELKLKIGAFELHVKRDVGKARAAANPPPATPVTTEPVVAPVVAVVPVPTPAAAVTTNGLASANLSASVSRAASLFGLLEAAAEKGLSFVTSPKVGLFRRSRNAKGKVGKPLVEVGSKIKEGQVVGYLEQLGTKQPVEALVAGEVVQVLWEDGESVGYGDPLISIRPYFGAGLN
jgi:biotin carboxyl carrier protein